jgi:hypothetical protein
VGVVAVPAVVGLPLAHDGALLANPARAQYPARDDGQYATGWPAGGAWVALADELRELGVADAAAACYGDCSPTLGWEMRDTGLQLVEPRSDGGDVTTLAVVSGALDTPAGLGDLQRIWRYDRPRDGTLLRLYRRGLSVHGRFVTTTDELRAALGLPDSGFDAWIASHPRARAWYVASVTRKD